MTIEIVRGDLLDALDRGEIHWAVHCVNGQGKFGPVLAAQIKKRYPKVFEEYLVALEGFKEDDWPILGQWQPVRLSRTKGVINLFGQEFYGTDKRYINYGAIGSCFYQMRNHYDKETILGFPFKFAANNGGGDWNTILEMIEYYFKDHSVKIYKL